MLALRPAEETAEAAWFDDVRETLMLPDGAEKARELLLDLFYEEEFRVATKCALSLSVCALATHCLVDDALWAAVLRDIVVQPGLRLLLTHDHFDKMTAYEYMALYDALSRRHDSHLSTSTALAHFLAECSAFSVDVITLDIVLNCLVSRLFYGDDCHAPATVCGAIVDELSLFDMPEVMAPIVSAPQFCEHALRQFFRARLESALEAWTPPQPLRTKSSPLFVTLMLLCRGRTPRRQFQSSVH